MCVNYLFAGNGNAADSFSKSESLLLCRELSPAEYIAIECSWICDYPRNEEANVAPVRHSCLDVTASVEIFTPLNERVFGIAFGKDG